MNMWVLRVILLVVSLLIAALASGRVSIWLLRTFLLLVLAQVVSLVNASHAIHVASPQAPDVAMMVMGLCGGMALLLYGMDQMGQALRRVAGDRMKLFLGKLTANRVMGLLTGAFVTAVIQSSSVTTVMLVGFISAGLMTLKEGIGVILGADIGTTVTTQIIAFNVGAYAPLLILIGFAMQLAGRHEHVKQEGAMVLGIGLIFYGLAAMSREMAPLRELQAFRDLMQSMSSQPLLAILVSAIFTALIHASAATMGVIFVLAQHGLIDLNAGIALALGANIGTCATAMLASIGKSREAIRAALAHVLFKVVGVAIAVPFIHQLANLVVNISPKDDIPRQLANAHSVFNVGIALLFLPFVGWFARLLNWMVPSRPEVLAGAVKPRYLDREVLKTPVLALGLVRKEVERIGERLERMLNTVPGAVFDGSAERALELKSLDDEIDTLYAAIIAYLGELSRHVVRSKTSDAVLCSTTAVNEFEAIGDIMETDLVHLAQHRAGLSEGFDPTALAGLREYLAAIHKAVAAALRAFIHDDLEAADLVQEMKVEVAALDARLRAERAEWLAAGDVTQRLALYTLAINILGHFYQIYYHAKRVGKLVRRLNDGSETPFDEDPD